MITGTTDIKDQNSKNIKHFLMQSENIVVVLQQEIKFTKCNKEGIRTFFL
jgi:hypothetical protein